MLYDNYAGDKEFRDFDGDHNSPRPESFLEFAMCFFYQRLQCD